MLSLNLIEGKRILLHHRCQSDLPQVAEEFLIQGEDEEMGPETISAHPRAHTHTHIYVIFI